LFTSSQVQKFTTELLEKFISSRPEGLSKRTIEFYRYTLTHFVGYPLSPDGVGSYLKSLTCRNAKLVHRPIQGAYPFLIFRYLSLTYLDFGDRRLFTRRLKPSLNTARTSIQVPAADIALTCTIVSHGDHHEHSGAKVKERRLRLRLLSR
jgi:hypothetical protein